jgi:hypothetical protein
MELANVCRGKLETFIVTRIINDFPNMGSKVGGSDDLLEILCALDAIFDVEFAERDGCNKIPIRLV